MKKGQKYLNRKTRLTVTVKGTYLEGGKTVVNFTHGWDKIQVGAMYLNVFNETYRPK